MWRARVLTVVNNALVLIPVPTYPCCTTRELIGVWEPPIWYLCLNWTCKLTRSKRILIFPQCITDLNVPLKGKGFTTGAGEIFPEVQVSLEQLVSLGPLYREWRKGALIGNRCSESPQRSLFSLFTVESLGRLNFPIKLNSCKASLVIHIQSADKLAWCCSSVLCYELYLKDFWECRSTSRQGDRKSGDD